ncbi:MAG: 30S ribosomal protein S3, partial [Bacteroidetes bacterium]|nr:30S ribosomal protein S3 [Bacteroidota bacterium]
MGQKANPIGNRLGIIRGWESNWYGSKKDYAGKLIEDNKIRSYLNARINKGG